MVLIVSSFFLSLSHFIFLSVLVARENTREIAMIVTRSFLSYRVLQFAKRVARFPLVLPRTFRQTKRPIRLYNGPLYSATLSLSLSPPFLDRCAYPEIMDG